MPWSLSRRVAWPPFEQDLLAAFETLAQQGARVGEHRPDKVLEAAQPGGDLRDVVGLLAVDVLKDRVLLAQGRLELRLEDALVGDVLDADAVAGDLVLVGRADAPVGGPNAGVAQSYLAVRVEGYVVGHDEVRPAVDLEPVPDADAARLERLDLLDEHLGVHHHPVADGADDVLAHDARRDEVELELLLADADGVPGVVAAGVARDEVGVRGEGVADPSLPLVPPGQPEHDRGRQSSTSVVSKTGTPRWAEKPGSPNRNAIRSLRT